MSLATDLTYDQKEQLISWLSSEMPADIVVRRIDSENARNEGLAPWPMTTKRQVSDFKSELRAAIAEARMNNADTAIMRGYALRAQQASQANVWLHQLDALIDTVGTKLWKLIDRGAFDFELEQLVRQAVGDGRDPAFEEMDEEAVEGEVVGKTKHAPSKPSEKAKYSLDMGLDPARVFVADEAFKRATKLAYMYALLLAQRSKILEVTGRISGTIDTKTPIDWEGKSRKIEEAMARIQKLAATAQTIEPDDDDGFDLDGP